MISANLALVKENRNWLLKDKETRELNALHDLFSPIYVEACKIPANLVKELKNYDERGEFLPGCGLEKRVQYITNVLDCSNHLAVELIRVNQ